MKYGHTKLFPTDIYVTDVDVDLDELANIILEREESESSTQKSNVGGWQSKDDLVDDKSFQPIFERTNEFFSEVICRSQGYNDVVIQIDNAWANVNRYKDFNKHHVHSWSDWSAAFPIKLPDKSERGGLTFMDPRIERLSRYSGDLIADINKTPQYDEWEYIHREGDLIIFPSWIRHYTNPNNTQEPRITVSYNITVSPPL